MARISLVEQYDNKDVIQQIYMLKTATDGWEERISASEQASNEALGMVSGFDERIQEVADAQADVDNKIEGFDTRIATANQTADNAVAKVDTLDRQVDTRIADQEVKGLSVASAGTGSYAVTAVKPNGNITSNSFNVSKVTSATIGAGEAQNSIYLQLNLSDGTTVRTNDTVISITGVEEDIHVTSIVLEDAPDAHTIKAIFTYNNGQSISSNTLTYDYPDIASSSSPGLVMGNDSLGGVQVDGQGRMTVVGWDTFATEDALEALEDEVGAVGQAGTIRNDLDIVKKLTDAGTYSGRVVNWVNPRTKANRGQEKDWKNTIAITTHNGETIETKEIEMSFGPPIRGMRNDEAEDLDYQAYSVPYINNLGDTLQQNIDTKQDELVVGVNMDDTPTVGSQNTVTSGGVANAIRNFSPTTILLMDKEIASSDWESATGQYQFAKRFVVERPLTDSDLTDNDNWVLGIVEGTRPNYITNMELTWSQGAQSAVLWVFSDARTDVSLTVLFDSVPGTGQTDVGFIYIPTTGSSLTIDSEISASSTNPVQNKVISAALDTKASTATTDAITQELADKQDKLTAGTGITIEDNVISASGSVAENVITTDWLLDDRNIGPYLVGGVYNASGFRSSESSTGAFRAVNGFNLRREVDGVITTTAINVETGPAIYNNKIESTAASGHVYNVPYINNLETTLQTTIGNKQDKLTAGTGISIVDGVISVNLSNANGVSF